MHMQLLHSDEKALFGWTRSGGRADLTSFHCRSDATSACAGKEAGEFNDAHAAAAFITGEPFRGGKYDFGTCRMTERNSDHIATMLSHRLTAPPRPVYTLHRKLSGAFLASMKLRANIECRSLLEDIFLNKHPEVLAEN